MIAAIFDLDGTLTSGSVLQGIQAHHRVHRTKRIPLHFFMSTHMIVWLLGRLGLVSEEKARGLWARNMGWAIRGWTPAEASPAFEWIAEQYVAPRAYPDMLDKVHEHQRAGHRVILLSGTPSPILEAIGRRLGISETVGTPLVVRRGKYSGASVPPACQGIHKVTRLNMYLGANHQISWPESYAYADSHTDMPLLEYVGHPVAVCPDEQLRAHAGRCGWTIIECPHMTMGNT